MPSEQPSTEHRVALAVPALPEYLRVVRLTASGLASRLGLGIDDVDDLRLALDELCFAIIGKGVVDEELRLVYLIGDSSLTISGEVVVDKATAEAASETVNEFSRQILAALVDDHSLDVDENSARFTLTKRRATAT